MPQINLYITRLAQSDLQKIYHFLYDLGAIQQANKVMQLLKASFVETLHRPNHGKTYILAVDGEQLEHVRELTVSYGKSGYRYLFRYDETNNTIMILAVKHVRENNYRLDLLTLH